MRQRTHQPLMIARQRIRGRGQPITKGDRLRMLAMRIARHDGGDVFFSKRKHRLPQIRQQPQYRQQFRAQRHTPGGCVQIIPTAASMQPPANIGAKFLDDEFLDIGIEIFLPVIHRHRVRPGFSHSNNFRQDPRHGIAGDDALAFQHQPMRQMHPHLMGKDIILRPRD